MTILVIAEHDHQSLKAATLNTVAAARKIGGDIHVLVAGTGCQAAAQKIGGDIHVLVAGSNCSAAAQEAASLSGVSTVKVAEPEKRSAGIKVADVAELVNKLKNEAKVI